MLKLAYFLRKIQTLRVNNSRILMIKNAKLSGYYCYINLNIWRDFQICISIYLIAAFTFLFFIITASLIDIILISFFDNGPCKYF